MRARLNFREPPGYSVHGGAPAWPKSVALTGPSPTGLSSGRPVKLRTFEKNDRERGERILARFAEGAEKVGAPPVKPDDIVIAPVRLVSADLVPGHWIDCRDAAPLKAAVPMCEAIPVYTMHWADPGCWLGMVADVAWDDTPMGLNRVPGITGHVAIEGDVGERAKAVARGVLRRSLKRWSIGFDLDLEPSHEEMARWTWEDYWLRLGDFDEDGNQYLLVLKSVTDVFELSVVDIGAIESARTTDALDNRQAPALRAAPIKPARLRGSHVAPSARRLEHAR